MCRLLAARFMDRGTLRPELKAFGKLSSVHKDGWGAALYPQARHLDSAVVHHATTPAKLDPEYGNLAKVVRGGTALLHMRQASAGPVTLENAHPFTLGRWSFAHNGNLVNFSEHRAQLESMISPELRPRLAGQTDSERCFLLFVTKLRELMAGDQERPREVAVALARTMQSVSQLTDEPKARSAMNFIATDGKQVVAARRDRPLYVSAEDASGPLGRLPRRGERLKSFKISSQPLTSDGTWHRVPNDSVIAVDRNLIAHSWRLSELTHP
jgi:predicted glutamine amidotransferase